MESLVNGGPELGDIMHNLPINDDKIVFYREIIEGVVSITERGGVDREVVKRLLGAFLLKTNDAMHPNTFNFTLPVLKVLAALGERDTFDQFKSITERVLPRARVAERRGVSYPLDIAWMVGRARRIAPIEELKAWWDTLDAESSWPFVEASYNFDMLPAYEEKQDVSSIEAALFACPNYHHNYFLKRIKPIVEKEIGVLASIGTDAALEALGRIILSAPIFHPTEGVCKDLRYMAICALGKRSNEFALIQLHKVIAEGVVSDRAALATAFANMGNFEMLEKMLQDSLCPVDEESYPAVIAAIVQAGTPEAIFRVLAPFIDHETPGVRKAALAQIFKHVVPVYRRQEILDFLLAKQADVHLLPEIVQGLFCLESEAGTEASALCALIMDPSLIAASPAMEDVMVDIAENQIWNRGFGFHTLKIVHALCHSSSRLVHIAIFKKIHENTEKYAGLQEIAYAASLEVIMNMMEGTALELIGQRRAKRPSDGGAGASAPKVQRL